VEYRKEKGGQKLVSEKVKRELKKLKSRAKQFTYKLKIYIVKERNENF